MMQYLQQCLDSVLNQTLSDIEVICVDDFSKDRSYEILQSYQHRDARVKVFHFEEAKSALQARKTGVMAAEGEYYQFCGYMLMARLLMKGGALSERAENEFFDQALTALQGESGLVCRASSTALRRYACQSTENARKLWKMLHPLASSDRMEVVSLIEEVKIEADSSC